MHKLVHRLLDATRATLLVALVLLAAKLCTQDLADIIITTSAPEPESISQVHARMSATMDTVYAHRYDTTPELTRAIRLAAVRHDIPIWLGIALVDAESNFHPHAVSWAGAIGLTQVMPATGATHCNLTPAHLTDPLLNLDCGFSYLRMLHSWFDDWNLALISYNRGAARMLSERAAGLGHGTSSRYARDILSSATN